MERLACQSQGSDSTELEGEHMKSEKTFEVDLNVEELANTEILIAAAETEDEMGCVLRFHLMLERLLTFYLKEKCKGEIAVYAKLPRDFGQKLGLAAAFGLPLPIAAVIHHVNSMRNKLAHGMKTAIDQGDAQQLSRLVNSMSAIEPEFHPVEKRYITIHSMNPDVRIKYGSEVRTDFLIASFAFWAVSTKALIMEAALNKIVPNQKRNTP
ncbi:hypothetical protein [Pseudomonas sp. Cab53]|uniref:hypothetical protein n=1 Tax=Pseudomonas sp. Cab53 TaxID=2678258 RepID=UPI001FD427A4|nr:hypothetical protein [Pseudomonas sp. Cab53]